MIDIRLAFVCPTTTRSDFSGFLRGAPLWFGAAFTSAAALTAGHGLRQLLQMEWLAPSSWNMEKDEMEHLHSFPWKRKSLASDTAAHCQTKLRQWFFLQPCYYKRVMLWMVVPSQCAQLFQSCLCSPSKNVHLLFCCGAEQPRAGIWQCWSLSQGGKCCTNHSVELEHGWEDAP